MRVETFSDIAPALPTSLFIVQDGGYFYIFRDEEHSNTDEEQPLRFVDSQLDPDFGDFEGAEAARNLVRVWLSEHKITFA